MQIMSAAQRKSQDQSFRWVWFRFHHSIRVGLAQHALRHGKNTSLAMTTLQSDRVTLDLTYTLTGVFIAQILIWFVRGTIRVAKENLCVVTSTARHMQCIVWTTCYFFRDPAFFFILILPGLVKNTFASFSQSDTSDNDIFASILLIFIIFPVSVMFVLVSTCVKREAREF